MPPSLRVVFARTFLAVWTSFNLPKSRDFCSKLFCVFFFFLFLHTHTEKNNKMLPVHIVVGGKGWHRNLHTFKKNQYMNICAEQNRSSRSAPHKHTHTQSKHTFTRVKTQTLAASPPLDVSIRWSNSRWKPRFLKSSVQVSVWKSCGSKANVWRCLFKSRQSKNGVYCEKRKIFSEWCPIGWASRSQI